MEYLVPSRRYTDPGERHKHYAKYIDPDKKTVGYLRWIELALIAPRQALAGLSLDDALHAPATSRL